MPVVIINQLSLPFKVFYDARNPLIVHLKHRTTEEVRPYFKKMLRGNANVIIKHFIKLKWSHAFKCGQGYLSALNWAQRNGKLKLKLIF